MELVKPSQRYSPKRVQSRSSQAGQRGGKKSRGGDNTKGGKAEYYPLDVTNEARVKKVSMQFIKNTTR
jgi:hypothetical protein